MIRCWNLMASSTITFNLCFDRLSVFTLRRSISAKCNRKSVQKASRKKHGPMNIERQQFCVPNNAYWLNDWCTKNKRCPVPVKRLYGVLKSVNQFIHALPGARCTKAAVRTRGNVDCTTVWCRCVHFGDHSEPMRRTPESLWNERIFASAGMAIWLASEPIVRPVGTTIRFPVDALWMNTNGTLNRLLESNCFYSLCFTVARNMATILFTLPVCPTTVKYGMRAVVM